MANDILTYNNDLYIAQSYITSNCEINSAYIRVAKTRVKSGAQSWHHAELSGRCYFAYSKLPKSVITKLLDAHSLASMATEYHDDVTEIIHNAIYSRFKVFLKDLDKEAAKSAAVIFEAANYCRINGISFSKSDFFVKLASEIELQGLKYLPTTWRNLRDKIRDYELTKNITEVVKIKNKDNSNAAIYSNNEMIKSWLIELGESQKNYSYSFIWRKIRIACEQNSIEKTPSVRWVSDFLSKPETQMIISGRFGVNSRFNSKYRGYTPTASALFAGDCWDIDGTRVNITDHRTFVMKDGKRVPANKFLYVVVVRDVMSGLPVGWEYCYEENHDVIINALAMAVRNTEYLPYEIRYDKFPGHTHQDWQWIETELNKIGVVMTQTVKPEHKNIERWWGTLQDVFMAESDYYYGEGVKSSRRYAHRAKEYIAEMRKKALQSGFNFDVACQETDKIINAYATTKFSKYSRKFKKIDKTPVELHEECSKKNTTVVDQPLFCFLFGLKKQVSIRNYMITTQINNAPFYYGIENVEVIEKYTGVKLLNCFDYEDLSKVHLFNDNNEYLGSFDAIIPAQQYGPNKDMRAVGTMKKIAKDMITHKTKRVAEMLVSNFNEELEVSSEMGAMLGGRIGKHTHEAAETAMLNELWNVDDEEEITINTRSKY